MSDEEVTKIITVTSDESKSPQDLEAEIAHAASTLGGLKKERAKKATTKTKKKPTTTKKASPKKPAITVAQRKTIEEEPIEAKEEPEEHVISVRTVKKVVKPVSAPTEPAEIKEDDGATKIQVNVKKAESLSAPTPETPAAKPSEPPKPITPPKPIISDSPKVEPKKIEELNPELPKTEDQEPNQDDSSEDETADKLSLLSTELAARATSKELQQEDEQQQAKVYDTNKYHLAIKPNRHHRNSALPLWLQITILVALIAGGALYALQTDLIDQITSLL